MKAFEEDGLEIGRLENGHHDFDWSLGDSFFASFDGSLIRKGQLRVLLGIERLDAVFRVSMNGEGEVEKECDNCLAPVRIPFKGHLNFVIKLTDSDQEDDPDHEVYYVKESDPRFYFSQHIYDLVNIGLPLRSTCSDPGASPECNPEMVKRLNQEGQDEQQEEESDPRWDKLKDLFNNNK